MDAVLRKTMMTRLFVLSLNRPLSHMTLDPLTILTNHSTELEARYTEIQSELLKTDACDHVDALKLVPHLFSLIDSFRFSCRSWDRLYAEYGSPSSALPLKKRLSDMELNLGVRFSSLCANILFQQFPEASTKDLRRYQRLNEEAMRSQYSS